MSESIYSILGGESANSGSPQGSVLGSWFSLVEAFIVIEHALRIELNAKHAATLPGFDTMTALSQYPAGLRMSDLASRLAVTKGNVTSVVQRLENEGWVKRETQVSDRRSQLVTLTPAGKKLFGQMQQTYRAIVLERFSNLSERQVKQLTQRLRQLG